MRLLRAMVTCHLQLRRDLDFSPRMNERLATPPVYEENVGTLVRKQQKERDKEK